MSLAWQLWLTRGSASVPLCGNHGRDIHLLRLLRRKASTPDIIPLRTAIFLLDNLDLSPYIAANFPGGEQMQSRYKASLVPMAGGASFFLVVTGPIRAL